MKVSRLILPLAVYAAIMIGAGWSAHAQNNWMTDVFGKKKSGETSKRQSRPAGHTSTAAQLLVSRRTLDNIDRAIATYRALAQRGDGEPLARGKPLRLGDTGARVAALVQRLAIHGDLPHQAASRNRGSFDRNVENAVKRFQLRNGLTPSGQLNSYTRSALNVSLDHRLDQLTRNRNRIAELLLVTEGKRYVLVNIPAYELQAVNGGRIEIYSRVVLGKPTTPTPVISAKIKALNTLPYWHVPQSIARRQLIPAIKKNPDYLAKQHIRVFASWGGQEVDPRAVNWWAPQGERYVFRQDPGPHNALGLLRLDMPNKHIVYMHDTPLKALYDYYLRPYSAGCVRVQTVFDVGEWLLRGDGHPAAGQLRSLIGQRVKETIKLKQPVDVHFVYISAWATDDGLVHFRPDIYRLDTQDTQTALAGGWKTRTTTVMP